MLNTILSNGDCFLFFPQAGPVIMSIEEKMEADARSIYVGNVCTRAQIGVGGSLYFKGLFNRSNLKGYLQNRWWIGGVEGWLGGGES